MSADGATEAEPSATTAGEDEGFPWYVKAALLATIITIVFVVVIDVLAVAGAF